jgi:hypothetical protein
MKRTSSILLALLVTVALVPGLFADHHNKGKDIVDTAVAAGSFSTLVAAVKAAGLVDTLKSPGPRMKRSQSFRQAQLRRSSRTKKS